MTQRGLHGAAAALTFMAAFACATSDLAAQDAMREVLNLVERGRNDEALTKLNEVLAKDMPSEEALALRDKLSSDEWIKVMIQNDRLGEAVMTLMNRSRPAEAAKTADAAAIKTLVDAAMGEDWAARQKALLALKLNHGEYAVTGIWRALGSGDTNVRTMAMQACRALGDDAVGPLVAVMKGGDGMAAANAALVLGMLKDARSMPYLALAAAGADGMVKEAAARANASGDLVALGEMFYNRDPMVCRHTRSTYVVWTMAKAEGADSADLVAREVPRDLWHLKMAEETLADAIRRDRTNVKAATLMVSTLLAEVEFAKNLGKDGDEGAAAGALNQARLLASAAGTALLDEVVKNALAGGRADVAAAAVGLLAEQVDSTSFSAPNGLTMALASAHKAPRHAAAVAIATIRPMAAFEGSDQVVPALCEALGQDAIRNVLVIDDNTDTRNKIVAGLSAKRYFAVGTDNGAMGVGMLRDWPVEDAVIVRYDLGRPNVTDVVRGIRADARTAGVPVFILAEDKHMEAAKAAFGDGVGYLAASASAETMEPMVAEKVKTVDAARESATMTAAAAARALAGLKPCCGTLPSAGANKALLATLKGGDDRVRMPAIAALGTIASADSADGLLEVVKDGGASDEIRGSALIALARVARASGKVPADVAGALRGMMEGASPALQGHMATAIGIMPLAPQTRAGLMLMLRPRVAVDMVK